MKFILLPTVASLVDARYERESLLLQNGLKSFTPPLRLIERFCESRDELEEHKAFLIANKKSFLGGGDLEEYRTHFEELRRQATERYEKTKNIWETGLTAFDRHLKRMEVENPRYLGQISQECAKQSAELFSQEVPFFSSGLSHQFSEHEPNARLNLYREVMDTNAGMLGFSLDKRLSSKGKPIYAKTVVDDWRIGFEVDAVNLKQPVGEPFTRSHTNETFLPGPFMAMWLNLYHVPVGTRRGDKRQVVRPDAFFPIADYFYRPYTNFYTLMELEALINIRLRMYKLIAPELEPRLKLDIENIERESDTAIKKPSPSRV